MRELDDDEKANLLANPLHGFVMNDPSIWTPEQWWALKCEHAQKFHDIGALYNPEVRGIDDGSIEFWCYYDNFDNEDDGWYWNLDRKTCEFSN